MQRFRICTILLVSLTLAPAQLVSLDDTDGEQASRDRAGALDAVLNTARNSTEKHEMFRTYKRNILQERFAADVMAIWSANAAAHAGDAPSDALPYPITKTAEIGLYRSYTI